MPDTYYLVNTTAAEPKPNDMVDTSVSFADGSYVGCKDALSANGASNVSEAVLIGLGAGAGVSYYKLLNFITPPLEAQTIAAGTWTIYLYGGLSANPIIATLHLQARLYYWDDDTDALGAFIGTAQMSTALSRTIGLRTLTVSPGAISLAEGQRIAIDVYVTLDDDLADAGAAITVRFWHNSGTYPSRIVIPQSVNELVGIGQVIMMNAF